jgi:hypothetical protein
MNFIHKLVHKLEDYIFASFIFCFVLFCFVLFFFTLVFEPFRMHIRVGWLVTKHLSGGQGRPDPTVKALVSKQNLNPSSWRI